MLLLTLVFSMYLAKAVKAQTVKELQSYTNKDLKSLEWKKNNMVLALTDERSKDQIKILANKVLLKPNNIKCVPVKIKGTNFQVAIGKGVTHLLNEEGEPVAMTNQGRSKIFYDQKIYTRKSKRFQNAIRYYNSEGQLVIEGLEWEGTISIKNFSGVKNNPLLAMCLEEMIRGETVGKKPLEKLLPGNRKGFN